MDMTMDAIAIVSTMALICVALFLRRRLATQERNFGSVLYAMRERYGKQLPSDEAEKLIRCWVSTVLTRLAILGCLIATVAGLAYMLLVSLQPHFAAVLRYTILGGAVVSLLAYVLADLVIIHASRPFSLKQCARSRWPRWFDR